jgi:flagellar protein FliO/FliZ
VKAPHAAAKPSASKAKPFLQDYKDPKKEEGELPLGKVLLDLFLKLVVVLGIAWVAIYILSKFKGTGGPLPGARKGHMKVLESVNLGPNRSVHLVRVGEKVLVVGSTPEQVNTLGEIDDPALRDELLHERSPFSFNAQLNDALKREEIEPADLTGNVRGGAKHIWDRVREIRGLSGDNGASK